MLVIEEQSPYAPEIAAQALKDNQIICFATETVYALACNASSNEAVLRLYQTKERQPEKPIAVFVKNLTMAKKFLNFNDQEEQIAKNFMPGMITLVLEKKINPDQNISVSPLLNNNEKTLGLRIPNHQFCLKLLNIFDGVIAATSANISNQEAATKAAEAIKYFDQKIDLLIDGGVCEHKMASTVLKIDDGKVRILRAGPITPSLL